MRTLPFRALVWAVKKSFFFPTFSFNFIVLTKFNLLIHCKYARCERCHVFVEDSPHAFVVHHEDVVSQGLGVGVQEELNLN
jgi:hypothetical protein